MNEIIKLQRQLIATIAKTAEVTNRCNEHLRMINQMLKGNPALAQKKPVRQKWLGATVRLKNSKTSATAEVASCTVEIAGRKVPGGVRLDRPLADFHYWNKEDLEIVKPASTKGRAS